MTDRGSDSERLAAFRATLDADEPPAALSAPVAALWFLEKGNWERAHALVQDDPSAAGAWVHALVHRIEGDDWNARYWYRRAGEPEGKGDPAMERAAMLARLLP